MRFLPLAVALGTMRSPAGVLRHGRGLHVRVSAAPFFNENNNAKSDALDTVNPAGAVLVLVRPFLDQNVGAVARSMLNFGRWCRPNNRPNPYRRRDAAARATSARRLVGAAYRRPRL